jgi:sugar/nucleoside kinase (ribokinase family)
MSQSSPPAILCAGIAVLDEIFRVESFPIPETKTQASAYAAVVGGCAANAAIAIARLGGSARLAAPLGDDVIGDRILADLVAERVDCSSVVRVAGVTSPLSAVLIDTSGERMIVNHRGSALAVAAVGDAEAIVADVDAVLADNRFPEFVLPICATGRKRGLPVVLDADKPTRQTDALLTAATHIIFSAEGLRTTADHRALGEALLKIARRTPAFLAVTDGPNDIQWLDGGSVRRLPVFAIDAADTLGAGDVFHGAFALALAEGRNEPEALRFATATAAIKCTRFGGGSAAPTRAEVESLLGSR